MRAHSRWMSAAAMQLAVGCSGDAPAPAPAPAPAVEGPLAVATLSWPVHRLAAALQDQAGLSAADALQLRCHLPDETDPPAWTPTSAEVDALLQADLILASGPGYEAWLSTASLPADRLVLTAAEVPVVRREARRHQHGDGPAHSHGTTDPHTWIDPAMAVLQLEAISSSWLRLRPDWSPRLEPALRALSAELAERDAALGAAFSALGARPLAANHPSHGHLARHHDLDIQVFDLDPAAVPAAGVVGAVQDWVTASGPSALLLWESAPSEAVVAALPNSLEHVVFDTLEAPMEEGARAELLGRIDRNIATLRALSSAVP